MTSHTTTVTADDGVALCVETWPGTSPDAPVVLGLHGISANRLAFLALLDEFRGDVHFVSFDARGRGRSDKPTDLAAYGHRRNAEDAAAVLRALGHRDVVVVGQSMGAWVGLQLAAHHADLVRAIVLVDGGYFEDLHPGESAEERVTSLMGAGWRLRLRLTLPSRETLFTLYQSLPAFAGVWSPHLEAMLSEGLEDLPDGTVRSRSYAEGIEVDALDYFVPLEHPYVRADLALVRCPVHLLRAPRGFDISPETVAPLLPESAVVAFQREVPQLTVETIPDTNHYTLNLAGPGAPAVADAVRAALK